MPRAGRRGRGAPWRAWCTDISRLQAALIAPTASFLAAPSPLFSARVPAQRVGARPALRRDSLALRMALPSVDVAPHIEFLNTVAKGRTHPREQQLQLFAQILSLRGHAPADPADRKALHPFMVPVTKHTDTGQITGLLYDINSDPSAPPQVVRTAAGGGPGLELVSPSLDFQVKRLAIEEDFKGSHEAADVVAAATANGLLIDAGAAKASSLGLERYLLVNADPTLDLYTWLVADWLSKDKTEEALITCARAARQPVLQDWGATHLLHSDSLSRVGEMRGDDRRLEARDCARAALQLPLWSSGARVQVRTSQCR